MTNPEAQNAAEGQQEEVSVLDSLLNKVDLQAPSERTEIIGSVEDADQSQRLVMAVNHLI